MKQQRKKLIYCGCCLQINDPEKGDDNWINEEKYREKHYDDPRLIDGGITTIDYCAACQKLHHSDTDFGDSGYEDSADFTGFAST